jgi:hypothetical protein
MAELPTPSAVVPAYSRWRASAVTFGPAGRLLASIVVLVPIVYAVFVNALFVFTAALWLFLLPTAWRDIWARVRVRSDPAPRIPDRLPAEHCEADAIATRTGTRRW